MNKYICLVEDDESLSEAWTILLRDEGYDVAHRTDGSDMARLIRKRLPDLFILDYLLPGEDGLKIAGRIRNRKDTVRVPIIIVSAANITNMQRIYDAGVNAYFMKPVSIGQFLDTISLLTHDPGKGYFPGKVSL